MRLSKLLVLLSCASCSALLLQGTRGTSLRATLRAASVQLPSGRVGKMVASEPAVVVSEDYRLAASLIGAGSLIIFAPWIPGGFCLLLGLFLVVQTLRIRFVFDDDSFEVKTKEFDEILSGDAALAKTGQNFAVGGENRWAYSSFVNWDFFPGERLPILVYFKETQTPEDKWNVGPGTLANSAEALAAGAVKGQVHFFPCIGSAKVLREQFSQKGCAKL